MLDSKDQHVCSLPKVLSTSGPHHITGDTEFLIHSLERLLNHHTHRICRGLGIRKSNLWLHCKPCNTIAGSTMLAKIQVANSYSSHGLTHPYVSFHIVTLFLPVFHSPHHSQTVKMEFLYKATFCELGHYTQLLPALLWHCNISNFYKQVLQADWFVRKGLKCIAVVFIRVTLKRESWVQKVRDKYESTPVQS